MMKIDENVDFALILNLVFTLIFSLFSNRGYLPSVIISFLDIIKMCIKFSEF